MTKTKFSLIVLALALVIQAAFHYGTVDTVTVTINDKERITNQDESYYLIYTGNETFRNADSLWHLKFRSSDVQGNLRRGEPYRLKVYGWRFPFFSWYRNVIGVVPMDDKQKESL